MGNFNLNCLYDFSLLDIYDDNVWNDIHSAIYELLKRKVKENQVDISDDKLNHYAGEIFTHYRETHQIYEFNYHHLEDFVYFVERDIMNILWVDKARKDMELIFKIKDNKSYFENKLNEISLLKNGWVLGGKKISIIAIDYIRKLLNELNNTDLKDWYIVPFINGSILLYYRTSTKYIACINIAENSISYFHECPYKCREYYKGNMDEGFNKIIELIKNIHNIK